MPLRAGARLGPYEILSPLGAGGMGEVYRARDTQLLRDVAVKILSPSFSSDSDRLRRFSLEAQAAAALNHPNILSVFHIGESDGSPYIVTELLEGETVAERLRRGPMRLRESLEAGAAVAWGLAAAHDKGIVHRDIKPANIFMVSDGRVKVLDFGLAGLRPQTPASEDATGLRPKRTEPGLVLGTVGYMSPEQVRGQTADSRSDIFALGVVLYEMLTGRRAFDRPTAVETMSAILNEDPPATSETARLMPPAVSRVVRRCLEKNPEKRFQSAEDLAFALEGLVDSGSSPSTEAAAVPSRHRYIVAAGLFLLLAALAAGEYLRRKNTAAALPVNSVVELQPLTGKGTAFKSAVSPDGRYVAWVNRESGNDELRLLQVASERDVMLLPASPLKIGSLHFSPDGDYVYFLRQLEREDPDRYGVFRATALGGTATPLATDVGVGYERSLTVSPDGAQIAYIGESDNAPIVSVDRNGQNRRVVAKGRESEYFWFIEWSPLADRIAVVVVGDDPCDMRLATIEVASGMVRDFPTRNCWSALGQPAWSPDGSHIFAPGSGPTGGPAGGIMQLWSFDAQTGAYAPLTASSAPFSQWTLSASAKGTLVANTFVGDSIVWILDASGQSQQLSSIRGGATDSLAWVDRRIVTANMVKMLVHELDGREPVSLRGPTRNYRLVHRCGSDSVVSWASDDGATFIARTDLATGLMTPVSDGPGYGPTCTADGKTLLFVRCHRGGPCTLMRKSLDSGKPTVVPGFDPDSWWPSISPDGTQVLVFQPKPGSPFQWASVFPVSGGNATTLTIPVPASEISFPGIGTHEKRLKWAADGKSLLFVRRDANGVDNVWSASSAGGPAKPLTSFVDPLRIFAFDMGPDNQLAVSRGKYISDVVLIKNVR